MRSGRRRAVELDVSRAVDRGRAGGREIRLRLDADDRRERAEGHGPGDDRGRRLLDARAGDPVGLGRAAPARQEPADRRTRWPAGRIRRRPPRPSAWRSSRLTPTPPGGPGLRPARLVVLGVASSSSSRSSSSARTAAAGAVVEGVGRDRRDRQRPAESESRSRARRSASPAAPVTVTEYGDLECPFCADFAKGAENNLISSDVRSGRSSWSIGRWRRRPRTRRCSRPSRPAPTPRAPRIGRLNFIELFYNEQGVEDSGYVTHELPRRPGEADPGPRLLEVAVGEHVDHVLERRPLRPAGRRQGGLQLDADARRQRAEGQPPDHLGDDRLRDARVGDQVRRLTAAPQRGRPAWDPARGLR